MRKRILPEAVETGDLQALKDALEADPGASKTKDPTGSRCFTGRHSGEGWIWWNCSSKTSPF
jgi:hypothetical protein